MATPAKTVQPREKKTKTNKVVNVTVEPEDANFGNSDFVGETQSGVSPKDSGNKIRNESGLAK